MQVCGFTPTEQRGKLHKRRYITHWCYTANIGKYTNYYSAMTPTPQKGGFSDIRLWPCYMAYSGTILFLSPLIGTFWSYVLVSIPAFYVAHRVAQIQAKDPEALLNAYRQIDKIYAEIDRRDVTRAKQAQKSAAAVYNSESPTPTAILHPLASAVSIPE